MSEQHTPTPCTISVYGNVEKDHESIRVSGFALSGGSESKANARRIVACVNFCEGISNSDIERLQGVENGLARVIDRAKEFKQQRDELLSALKEITSDYSDRFDLESPSTNLGIKTVIKAANEAIAKAEQ